MIEGEHHVKFVTCQCLRAGTPDVMERLDKSEDVGPTSYYFRMNPVFETAPVNTTG
jgi:hypothetical protein